MPAKSSTDPRAAAVEVLLAVLGRGRSLDRALAEHAPMDADGRDVGLCRAIAYGVLRHHRRLGAIRDRFLRTRLRDRDQDMALLLEIGFFQLVAMDVPAHAAVSETVAVARQRGKPWAAKLINAVLRRFQRDGDGCLAAVDADPAQRDSVPDWLLNRLRADWPAQWPELLAAQNDRAPMTLRVNQRRVSLTDYQHRLAAAGIAAAPLPGFDAALVLQTPVNVEALPGFDAGDCSVQDAVAQLAAPLLDAADHHRVLDACAAPGGKSAHLLERSRPSLLALDSDAARLQRVSETLDRLGLEGECRAADATLADQWWDGRPFDRILIDAPCSGTGVIRRHPDIKWLRRDADIARLADEQRRLLEALWPLLAVGGRLVYCTCSIIRAENESVVAAFVGDHADDVRAIPPGLSVGQSTGYGQQILTGEAGVDGFYYACLEKR
ncbi:16S rRNA (cytosine(967)-C(5))-methyltransferase RsmB [Spiribacter vilamensis]|uniref:16S rRNA (cytosine(967)-C(5))-methyltransferase n=1 Tax=Spiribacter vilamensis TaxID=531306 RepID=A0A4Q8D2B2_9GAMM|nr:16S rRNA (cytosine(967)-C(5))-methyltransferase RsmB [Spiribacter vilamensis]RZU99472.1 16S rRNA m(5)C-967 methyltransferase [Spiribacter vilamensis]TVO61556.1 16S rRNA (cytosine(967)-C(5))-methyltransferase RsmB [Spiribacter vilamensis]